MKRKTVMTILFLWGILLCADAVLCFLGFGLLMSMSLGIPSALGAVIWGIINILFTILFWCTITNDAIEF